MSVLADSVSSLEAAVTALNPVVASAVTELSDANADPALAARVQAATASLVSMTANLSAAVNPPAAPAPAAPAP